MMRTRFAIAVAAIAALAIAGCGGGSSSSTTGAEGAPLPKDEFVAKANAVCANGNKEIQAESKKVFASGQPPSQAEQEKFVTDTVIPNVQQQIDGVAALPAPSGDESKIQAIVDAAQSALDKAKQDPSLLTDQAQSDVFAQANKLTHAYGLTQCD